MWSGVRLIKPRAQYFVDAQRNARDPLAGACGTDPMVLGQGRSGSANGPSKFIVLVEIFGTLVIRTLGY
jgi:hypothetical protein